MSRSPAEPFPAGSRDSQLGGPPADWRYAVSHSSRSATAPGDSLASISLAERVRRRVLLATIGGMLLGAALTAGALAAKPSWYDRLQEAVRPSVAAPATVP